MDLTGLNETERARLDAAGFDAALASAVADEAETMRFLWLRRSGFNAVTGIAGAAGAAAVANVFAAEFGPLGAWLPILLPLIAGALGVAPWWEIQRVKSVSRTRWAARRLAALAVAADPDDEADEDWIALQRLAEPASGAPSTYEALAAVAERLDAGEAGAALTEPPGGGAPRASGAASDGGRRAEPAEAPAGPGRGGAARPPNPAPSRMTAAPARSMTPDQRDRLHDAIRTGVVITALVTLLILLLIRRQMGA